MPRSIAQLLALNLDRAVIPMDEGGAQLFTEGNPGYMLDQVAQAAVASARAAILVELAEILEEVVEIEQHIHNDELWWGAVAVPDTTNACESNVDRPFTAVSGNDDWGVAIPIIGSADNPVKAWQTSFDLHRIAISGVDNGTPWKIRFLYGNGTSSSAQAIAAGRTTETMSIASGVGNNIGAGPSDIRMRVLPVGWRVWAQVWNFTNLDTLSFFAGAHGYPVRSL